MSEHNEIEFHNTISPGHFNCLCLKRTFLWLPWRIMTSPALKPQRCNMWASQDGAHNGLKEWGDSPSDHTPHGPDFCGWGPDQATPCRICGNLYKVAWGELPISTVVIGLTLGTWPSSLEGNLSQPLPHAGYLGGPVFWPNSMWGNYCLCLIRVRIGTIVTTDTIV